MSRQHLVTVHQLQAEGYGEKKSGTAFFNVDDDYGSIAVSSTVTLPTFLVCQDYLVTFIQFNSERSAMDWFTRHQNYITWVKRLFRIQNQKSMGIVDIPLKDMLIDRNDFMCPEILGEEGPSAKERLEEMARELQDMDDIYKEIGDEIFELTREL